MYHSEEELEENMKLVDDLVKKPKLDLSNFLQDMVHTLDISCYNLENVEELYKEILSKTQEIVWKK